MTLPRKWGEYEGKESQRPAPLDMPVPEGEAVPRTSSRVIRSDPTAAYNTNLRQEREHPGHSRAISAAFSGHGCAKPYVRMED